MPDKSPTSLDHIKILHGIVRNEKVALELAAAIIRGRYGDIGLLDQEPLEIAECDGIWTIQGSAEKERIRQEAATREASTSARALRLRLRKNTGEVTYLDSQIAMLSNFQIP